MRPLLAVLKELDHAWAEETGIEVAAAAAADVSVANLSNASIYRHRNFR